MASLIPGFEYDIFISYRQKDNKGGRQGAHSYGATQSREAGWVSEFVEALKTELASTFKEDISIYFDVNPHDGLLETHDVDASLREKLRCAIFIPVLSRTYCDPASFAWEHEFKAFIKQASNDQFGLNVKLPNGNVTSRILPVRIHDLETADISLLKTQIDLIQPVDFVYYSEGVNRPLSKQDDLAKDIKQLIYRDQVNKTALAVKGIITVLKGGTDSYSKAPSAGQPQPQERTVDETPAKPGKNKLITGAVIFATIFVAGILLYPGITGRKNPGRLISEDGKIPVVIMPFQNMTNDSTWDVWQDGIQSILITSLSYAEDLKIRKAETINGIIERQNLTNFASLTPSDANLISKNLETTVNIQGSIKQSGTTIRINAQLIDTKTGEALQAFSIDAASDSTLLPALDTLSVRILKFLMISIMKKELPPDSGGWRLTGSPEALKYFFYGLKSTDRLSALKWYQKSVAADSGFFDGLNNLWHSYLNLGMIKEGRQLCLSICSKGDSWNRSERLWTDFQYARSFLTYTDQIECLKRLLEDDDRVTSYHFVLGSLYNRMGQYDKAISEFERMFELGKKWDIKPLSFDYTYLGDAYYKAGEFSKAGKLYKKAEKEFPDYHFLAWNQTVLALSRGDSITANRYLKKVVAFLKDRGDPEASIMDDIGSIYSEAGIMERAEEYKRKALSLEPERAPRIRFLAAFLIENDRNVDEGLELIEKYLKIRPDNYLISDIKGWGLYKKGRYKESLEILQRSWDQRLAVALYDYSAFLHLEAAKKAVAGMK